MAIAQFKQVIINNNNSIATLGREPGWKVPSLLITVEKGTIVIPVSKKMANYLESMEVPVQG